MRPYKTRLVLGLLCSLCYALSNVLLMLVIKLVPNVLFSRPGDHDLEDFLHSFDKVFNFFKVGIPDWLRQLHGPQSYGGLLLVIGTFPLVMLLRGLFGYLNVYLMNWVATRGIADLRLKLFDHLQNLSLDFFHTARTGNLISRITNDTSTVHQTIAYSVATMIKDPITVIGLLAVLLYQQTGLTLISMVVFPVCVVPVIIYGRKIRKSAKALQSHLADLADVMHEAFTGNRIVKAYNLEATVLARFRNALRSYVGQYMRILRAQEIPGPVIEFLASLGVAMVFIYVAVWANPKPRPGDMMQFISSIFFMYAPIKAISKLQNQLEQARAASQRVFDLLDERSSVQETASPVPLKAANADIRFENIDFNYGEKAVLRGINLTLKAGQMTAIVGASGSGKTTLTNLLLRFYDPQGGSVRIGGTDIRDVAIRDLRRQVALVTQDIVLFNDTIRENIALGRPGATDAEIDAAAKHAYARDFILEKEQGYATLVGERGAALSVGQRQRISIARAILKDAPILVLDEATSALDSESERMVQKALEELMKGRTTLCIAHRLSTIQKADVIVVLDAGRIVESGTHSELMEKRGLYCRLYELQFQPANPVLGSTT